MKILFQARPTPIEILCAWADLGRTMMHQLISPDWMMMRLAVIALDLATVALIVCLAGYLTKMRRWSVSRATTVIGQCQFARREGRHVHRVSLTARTRPSRSTPWPASARLALLLGTRRLAICCHCSRVRSPAA
jgi:hypothetical protein